MIWITNSENRFIKTNPTGNGQLRFASIYILDLPFRISTGKIAQFTDVFQDYQAEIWIFNKIPVYNPASSMPGNGIRSGLWKDRCSRILVFLEDKRPIQDPLKPIKQKFEIGESPELPQKPESEFIARNIIDRLLISISTIYPYCISGPKGDCHFITPDNILDWLAFKLRFLIEGTGPIEKEFLWELAFENSCGQPSSGWVWSDPKNLQKTQKRAVQRFLTEKLDQHYYYELRYRARNFSVNGDDRSALLWDVIALETITEQIYKKWFDEVFLSNGSLTSKKKELKKDISKSLMLYNLLQFLCYSVLPQKSRAPDQIVEKALEAIKVRNKITHSVRTKDGNYHSKILTCRELNDARKDILKLMEYLMAFVEKIGDRLPIFTAFQP